MRSAWKNATVIYIILPLCWVVEYFHRKMMFISRTVDVFLQKKSTSQRWKSWNRKGEYGKSFSLRPQSKFFFWTHPWQKEGSLSRYRIEAAAAINKWDIKYKILRGGNEIDGDCQEEKVSNWYPPARGHIKLNVFSCLFWSPFAEISLLGVVLNHSNTTTL